MLSELVSLADVVRMRLDVSDDSVSVALEAEAGLTGLEKDGAILVGKGGQKRSLRISIAFFLLYSCDIVR